MPTTTGDNIFYRNTSTPAALESESATQAQSVQVALDNRKVKTFKWVNTAARNAQTGMTEGDVGDQADTDASYRYDGSAWRLVPNSAVFPTSVSSGSIDAQTGLVSTGAISSLTIVNAFPTTKSSRFRLFFDYTTSAATGVVLRLSSGGVDASTAYDVQSMRAYSSTVDTSQALNTSGASLSTLVIVGARVTGNCSIFEPNSVSPTWGRSEALSTVNAMTTSSGLTTVGFQHRTSAAYTDLTLLVATGTFTLNSLSIEALR